ncbi:MAG TPA: hypothetical protein DCW86_00495 [Actinobacteria bacterium]|nr:hypothetical protein [Actinomycetota bacterium]
MGSVGETLSVSRRRLGKSIQDVEEATKIRARYIQALEDEEFQILPDDFYVKAFIRTYCRFLDIDSEPLIREYEYRYKAIPQKVETRTPLLIDLKSQRRRPLPILILAGLLILGGLFIWGSFRGKVIVSPERMEAERFQEEIEMEETETTLEDTAQPGPEIAPPRAPKIITPSLQEFTIRVKVIDERGCWLRVLVDDVKVYEGTLAVGESKEWRAERSIFIRAGNARGIEVERDGEYLGPLGESGGVVEKIFSVEK